MKVWEAIEKFFLELARKIKLSKLADIYEAHLEGMRYLVFGALATAVNIAVYSLCFYLFNISNATSNVIAWIVAAVFAYYTNKVLVFESKVNTKKELLKEATSFFGCRLLTLAIDQAIMIITVDKLKFNGFLMKVISNIIVIILNFVFSKLFIFKKDNKSNFENENKNKEEVK